MILGDNFTAAILLILLGQSAEQNCPRTVSVSLRKMKNGPKNARKDVRKTTETSPKKKLKPLSCCSKKSLTGTSLTMLHRPQFDVQLIKISCAILFYTILYYTILYYTILYYTLHYAILHYTLLYYNILYYTILYSTMLEYYTLAYCTTLYILCLTFGPSMEAQRQGVPYVSTFCGDTETR